MIKPQFQSKWVILSSAWLIYFAFGIIHSPFAPLVTPIMSDLNLTYTQVGLISGSWPLIYIFSAYPLGLLIDRIGVKKSLSLGVFIISLSSLLKIFSTDFYSLFLFTALFGIGGPLISIGLPKFIGMSFKGKERKTGAGIYVSGNIMGSVTGLALTNLLLPIVGSWRMIFFWYSMFSFAVCFISLVVVPHPKFKSQTTSLMKMKDVKHILRLKKVWVVLLIGIVHFFLGHGIDNWLPKILEYKGFDIITVGFIASVGTFSAIFGSILLSKLTTYINKIYVLAIILSTCSLSILLFYFINDFFVILPIFILGFALGGLMPILLVTLIDIPEIGMKNIGGVIGLFFAVGEIGGFLGPFIVGFLRDMTGSFLPGLLALSISSFLMIFFLKIIK